VTRIINSQKVSEQIVALEIESAEIASSAQAGQIVLARIGSRASWIPKAVVDPDPERGTITVLVNGAGGGALESAECDLKGPYGRKKPLGKARKIFFIAERDGLGAVIGRLAEAKDAGLYTMVLAGYKTQSDVFWKERLDGKSDELYLLTDDGSYGIKGPLRSTIRAICEQTGDIDRLHAAGSLKLLRSAGDIARALKIPATVSLAAIFEDVAPSAPGTLEPGNPPAEPHLENRPGADQAYDWDGAIDLDAHTTDFDALARRFGILVTR